MRLGMWQRLSVVASVVWLIGGTLWFSNSEHNAWYKMAQASFQWCISQSASTRGVNCSDQMMADFDKSPHSNIWVNSFWLALGLLVTGWIVAALIIFVGRWVLAGRRANQA